MRVAFAGTITNEEVSCADMKLFPLLCIEMQIIIYKYIMYD